MFFAPDNFIYFIALFAISIFSGTYLLFSYHRNRLLVLNALYFYLCAIRACTEYYLPQVEDFEIANRIAIFHSTIAYTLGVIICICTWFYIRPFRDFQRERLLNWIFIVVGMALPTPIVLYGYYQRLIFYFNPEKIDGYWRFTFNSDLLISQFYLFYIVYFINLLLATLFLVAIVREKVDRGRRIILLLFFIIAPIIFYQLGTSLQEGDWTVPAVAINFLVTGLIVSWFVSNYRIFQNSFEAATTDLLNSISDLAISTDLAFNITNANQLAKSKIELQKGKNITEVIAANSPVTVQHLRQEVKALVVEEKKKQELKIIDRDHTERIVELKISPFKKGETVAGYTFLLTDLSDIRAKEKELRNLHETKDRLFAIISHDLRKPALAFRGISKKVNHLIKKQQFETLNKFGNHIEKAAFSLNSLLDNLLSWALQQKNVLPYAPIELKVKEATKEIYELFYQIADNKGVDLVMNINDTTTVFSDPNAFTTIIRNLIDNAIKYTPTGGTVEISSVNQEDEVVVTITDTGIGMKQEMVEKIFELQSDKSQTGTAGEKGTGLGLSLVKDLVMLNKGNIQVSSKWNGGTTFEVRLPARA